MRIISDAHHVILRDLRPSDLDDYIRWMTKPMSWMMSDAPWEDAVMSKEDVISRVTNLIRRQSKRLKTDRRSRFEIVTKEGIHIGWVTTYRLTHQAMSLSVEDEALAIGIDVPEEAFWGLGYGTSALKMMMSYLRTHDQDKLYLQTWSGHERMIHVATKLGFVLCHRALKKRLVFGIPYDALTFVISLKSIEQTSLDMIV
jgi:RimJ/RimL family protein N-acetyltransferase